MEPQKYIMSKCIINYKIVDCIYNYNFGMYHVNVQGHLNILKSIKF